MKSVTRKKTKPKKVLSKISLNLLQAFFGVVAKSSCNRKVKLTASAFYYLDSSCGNLETVKSDILLEYFSAEADLLFDFTITRILSSKSESRLIDKSLSCSVTFQLLKDCSFPLSLNDGG